MPGKNIVWAFFSLMALGLVWVNSPALAQNQQVIRVGIRPYAPPIIYFEKINGDIQYKGSQAEMLTLLEKNMNVRFEYISSDDVAQRRTWLKEGRIDLIAGTGKDIELDPEILFVPTGVKLEYRIYAQKDCDVKACYYNFSNKQIVLITGVRYPEFLNHIKQSQKILVNTDVEALRMLNREPGRSLCDPIPDSE